MIDLEFMEVLKILALVMTIHYAIETAYTIKCLFDDSGEEK